MTTDPTIAATFSHTVRVETIRQRGTPAVVGVDTDALARIAAALGIASLERLEGRFTLTRNGERVRLEGHLDAELHQTCIVTLEPFAVALSLPVRLDFMPEADLAAIAARAARDAGKDTGEIDIEVKLNEDDPPEPIVDGVIDLGAVMLEFLALSLDPYPRKPGAAFAAAEPDVLLQSPFAALARLKRDE